SGLPDAPGGGGFLGWSISAGGGFERTTDTTTILIERDTRFTYEKELAFGMNFASVSADLKPYVKNLTDTQKPFPTSADFMAIAEQHKKCRAANIAALKKLKDDHVINEEQFARYVDSA